MNTAQAYDQRLRPAQETESEKAEPLLSTQQTPIDYPMDVIIDSSGLVMDNRNSPVGFIEEIFTRLTRRLVFEFLGGQVKMEELPRLGGLADGNDEFHRITPSPTFSKSSQLKLLDSTGNLHFSSIVFMDSDFIPRVVDYLCESVLLDSHDASSTTFISSLGHFRSKLVSQPAAHSIEESHQCSSINFFGNKKIAGLIAESSSDSKFLEPQVFMNCNGFSNGIELMSAPIPISSNHSENEMSETPVSKTAYTKDGHNIFDIVKKTLSHFAPNLYPLMLNNRLGSVTIESSSLITIINVQNSKNSTSDLDSVSSMDCTLLRRPCNDKFGASNKLATVSTDESVPKFSIPDPKRLNEFLYGNLEFPMLLASELQDEKLDTFDYPSLHEDSDSVDDKNLEDLSDNTFNDQFIDSICNYDKKTSDTSGVLIGLEDDSSSGDYKGMEVSVTLKISDPCYTEPLDTHWPTGVDLSFFDVSDHEVLLESYGLNNQDEYNDVDYTCESPTWPGKVDAAWKKATQMNLTDLALNKHSLSSFYDENSKNSVYLSLLDNNSEDYSSQGHPCSDGFRNSIVEPIIRTTGKSLVYAIPDPDVLGDFLFGNLNSATFLAAETQDRKADILDSSFGACYTDHSADVANSSDNCNVELLGSDSSNKDAVTFPFDFSDYYELLESYGLNEQDQHTDDFVCESPAWPGKV